LSTLSLHPTQTGTLPYLATVFPLESVVPNAQSIQSPDDPSLRASVLSRWPDGSASVAVLAGETAVTAGTTKFIRLQSGAVAGTALTPARVGQLVTNITVNCGALGNAAISDFSAPARTWWANERVICCRYRAPVGADPTLEAVIDVHAFASNRAFVEVVLENCKLNSASPVAPAAKSYSASVVVNGATIATVSSSGGPGSTHQAFRAWYASTWVGGDPGVEVTHDTASMQGHPMMHRLWKTTNRDLQALYQNDSYTPWSTGRLNVPGMGSTGDAAAIGSLTQWDTRYLQSGSKYVRRASIASALAALTCNINYRDSTSGLVPTFSEMSGRDFQNGRWPSQGGEPGWEHAHSPAVGLMAFLCRPSPCFIEIAQKAAVWQLSWGNGGNPALGSSYQVRGKAWTVRAWNHAIFLTPDGNPWKEPAQSKLHAGLLFLETYKTDARNKLGFIWAYAPTSMFDHNGSVAGFQQAIWEGHYLMVELHKGASSKILSGTQHAKYVEIADWAVAQPIRWVNEATAGEWRAITRYKTTMGAAVANAIDTQGNGTYAQHWDWLYSDAPPALSGQWLGIGEGSTLWSEAANTTDTSGAYYDAYWWAAFCAGVERGISGADAAWAKVTANITNLDSGASPWSAKFQAEPRWGFYPKNK